MRLVEAISRMKTGDTCRRKDESTRMMIDPRTENIIFADVEGEEFFDFDKEDILADDWEIIRAEPEVLTSIEAYKNRYIHPAKTPQEESTHICWFDSGFDEGDKNGQIKEWKRTTELRGAAALINYDGTVSLEKHGEYLQCIREALNNLNPPWENDEK